MKKFKVEAFNYRDFCLFLLGHFISFTGVWISNTALQWLIYKLTKSPFSLGLINFLSSIPILFLSFLTGVFIDRFDRKKLFAGILFFSAIPPLLIGLGLQFNLLHFPEIALLVFLSGCFSAFNVPLRQVIISDIIPIVILTQALSLQSISFNIARMVGPLISGWFISKDSFSICFYLNALAFLIYFVIVRFFIKNAGFKREKVKEGIFSSFKETLVYLKRHKRLLRVIISVSVFTFFGPSLVVLFPVIIHEGLGGGGKEFSLAFSAIGVGAILGAILVIIKKSVKNKPFHMFFAIFLLGIGLMGISLARSFFIIEIFALFVGFAFTNFIPIANSFLQEETEPHFRGRIISFFSMAFLGVYPFGNLTAGFLAKHIKYYYLIPVYVFLLVSINFFLLLKGNLKDAMLNEK